MNKLTTFSLTLAGVLLTPFALAKGNCNPENPSACKSELEQACLYYYMDDIELDGDFTIYEEEWHQDSAQAHEQKMKKDSEFKESGLLLTELQGLSLNNEQQSLLNEWDAYNKQFEQDWFKLCLSHPNKDNSLIDQLNWDEANLKNDLSYLQESRVFINKVNASLTEAQKKQLVQLGLMQVLP